MKKIVQGILVPVIASAICAAAWSVSEVKILKKEMSNNDAAHEKIEIKIDRILCKIGETSNCVR